MEKIGIVVKHLNVLSQENEKKLFGGFVFLGDVLRIDESGILARCRGGKASLMLKAESGIVIGKSLHLTFGREDVDEFKRTWPFVRKQAENEKKFADEMRVSLESAMGIVIETSGDYVHRTRFRGLDRLLAGYRLEDVYRNADIAVDCAARMFRKSEAEKERIKKEFDERMRERNVSRKYD